MRRALAALVLLTAPTAAAPAPHGPGCALTAAECAVVVREMAADDLEALDDEQAFGGSSDLKVRLALIDRQFARLQMRIDRLPPRVGREIARIRACQAREALALRKGTTNDDPKCR